MKCLASAAATLLGVVGVVGCGASAVRPTALVLGPEVLASVNEDGGRIRVEPSIVRTGETVAVAWNDSWAGRTRGSSIGVGIAWSHSSDGGRSFAFGDYMPGVSGADSWLSATPRGEILLQLLSWIPGEQTIRVYARGADQKWTVRGVAAGGTNVDKPAMATAAGDWVGIAYTAGYEIRFVGSQDAGTTWRPAIALSASSTRTRTGAAIAACGSRVLVAWLEGGGVTLNEVWASSSVDGGRSFSEPTRVHTLARSLQPPPGYALGVGPAAFISNNAWLTCSGDSEPAFHLTYSEGRIDGAAVLYQRSRIVNARAEWESPAVIAGGDSVWAFWPSVSVLGDGLAILYYDSRHSANGQQVMDAYLSVGTPGSFTSHRLSTVSTSWPGVAGDLEYAPVHRNFGDYITVSTDGRRGAAAWTDGRTGAPRIMVRTFELR